MVGEGRLGASTDVVSPGAMLPALSDSGSDSPVPMSLPGRAPVSGSTPGGAACDKGGAAGWATAADAATPSTTANNATTRHIARIAIPPAKRNSDADRGAGAIG